MNNPEKYKKACEHLLKVRELAYFPTGSKSKNWKGGYSTLAAHCHGNLLLYTQWKYPKLVTAGFKCSTCGSPKELQVHHSKIKMNEIYKLVKGELGISDNDLDVEDNKNKIANAVAKYHIDNNIEGIVLCHDCHKQEHPSLNF
jgi:hypothetical protein